VIVLVLFLGVLLVRVWVGVDMVAVAVLLAVSLDRLTVSATARSSARWFLSGAVGAETDDSEVGEASLEAEELFHLVANGVELLRYDRPYRSAALAGEEFAFAVSDECIEAWAVSEVDMPRETVPLERFQVAVDRGDVELQRGGDVLGRDRAFCREERLQDEPAGGREPQP
jgi:hypothetical protein